MPNIPIWPEDVRPRIRAAAAAEPVRKLVVLDDDPTGTQTVYDVPVLTTWDVETLREEIARPGACFYILTNSRALCAEDARRLNQEIAGRLRAAVADSPFALTLVSRSDSTLRGHYPLETDVLAEELGPFDATFLIPYFEAGGRYTIEDVHYVAEGERLVPAAETPFARDAVFGYRSSNLREYVEEKTGGRVKAREVGSLTLEELRRGGPEAVTAKLFALPAGAVCIVNAAAPRDLDVFVAGLAEAEARGKRYLFRTAAQFVAARLGLEPRPMWTPPPGAAGSGGLIVAGSYVPKTTAQLDGLLAKGGALGIELPVDELLSNRRERLLASALDCMRDALAAGRSVTVYTSRRLVTGADAKASLGIGAQVSAALVELVQRLTPRPRWLVAKGGITSSDLATSGLGVKRAMVQGQILPGVPVWELGPETKYPGLHYVVFPGNVGGPEALAEAVERLEN